MGSFKGTGRNQGPRRRRRTQGQQPVGFLWVESLERRTLLSTTPFKPTSTNLADIQNGPMASEGQTLINLYQDYLKGDSSSQLASLFPTLQFQGSSVSIGVNGTGTFTSFENALKTLGVQVSSASTTYGLVDGYAPIASLPQIAELPQTLDATPTEKPQTQVIYDGVTYQGEAANQAYQALNANTASTQFGVNGTGIKVGVLSDSVSQYAGGLADSVKTGDLPSNVTVLQDGPAGSTDEGRAMLENIHDIAPGASLYFATADSTELNFANNIQALASDGVNVIGDDVRYNDEPMFQDGIIAQAVDNVVAAGHVYFDSAGNQANDGYLSSFRGVSATVGSLGSGTFMNFNPGNGVTTELPITVGAQASAANPADIVMQFDQPFATQQPAGSTAAPTSEVDFYILDSNGNVVASSTNNNVATREPFQEALVTTPGSYFVVMQLASGPAPGHVEFVEANENVDLTVSQQFGSAGGTYYPTSFGHATSASTIGVGAVPWWAPSPFLGQTPLNSEPFSSFGPGISVFNVNGTPKASPQLVLGPVVSAPDGGNTSFFTPGQIIDTSNPPFPGEPATATNLSQNLPTFFGTSSATPNLEAVAALMLQKFPSLTPAQIKNAMIASTTPLNGATKGSWNAQGGYGEVNAVSAIESVNILSVSSTSPSFGQILTGTAAAPVPSFITVTFNQPINFSTLTASDLVFTGTPAGVTATVGTPIAVNDPVNPTIVEFPFTVSTAANVKTANGTYTFRIQGPVTSETGNALVPYSSNFTLADTIAPRVSNVTLNGRIVTVQFNEAMRASTINRNTVLLIRANNPQGQFNQPSNIQLNSDPRLTVSYDPTTDSAIINLSALDQDELPTDTYAVVVLAGDNGQPSVTDLVGNQLNGSFSGVFPSGYPNGPMATNNTFVDILGQQTLFPPIITSLTLAPGSDTGVSGDSNTSISTPQFVGQVSASFPGTVAGLTVVAEFSGLHGGSLNLATGSGGRGFTGSFDVTATTNATGGFVIQAPFLPEGYETVRVVVIGQPDSPPLPGLSASRDQSFRIDHTAPFVNDATLVPGGAALPGGNTGATLSGLSTLSLNVYDPVNPTSGALATPTQILLPALNPATADILGNYSLVNLTTGVDESKYIASANFVATGSDFVSAPSRVNTGAPFAGRVDLTFNPGLPAGHYLFIAHTSETVSGTVYPGLTDAAGNPLDETGLLGQPDFLLNLDIQPTPAYITNEVALTSYNSGNPGASIIDGGPRAFYEVPAAGTTPRAPAPPTAWVVDFSNPLNPTADYSNALQLIASADSPGGTPDGNFGTLGEGGLGSSGTGFTRITDVTVTLEDQDGTQPGHPGFVGNRLVLQLDAGVTLAPDDYRLYIPNSGSTEITDVYGHQLDGEFLGNQTAVGSTYDVSPITGQLLPQPLSTFEAQNLATPFWQDFLPNGDFPTASGSTTPYQPGRMSGDGVAGGAFMTGFTVVPNGNIIYARPGYQQDPLNPATTPDGSLAKPYPVLAPQATATAANGGDLNAISNFFNFNPEYDRAGLGMFAESALYAAQVASANGPVVVIALPGIPQTDPNTGVTSTPTFVLQAPSGSDPVINNGSASVPFDTTLAFAQGSVLKLQNASLFVQNQGSALQALGGPNPNQQVNFTSYADDSIAGDTNHNGSDTSPQGGDWGGIIFRNFDQAATPTQTFPIDGTLQGPNGAAAISGAQDAMSILNFANVRYAGGAVPSTNGIRYDAITLYNSRPAITNDSITIPQPATGSVNGVQAAISADFDSFREDDTARGPLVRQTAVANYSLNGIWIRPNLVNGLTGYAQATNAMTYPANPASLGGNINYTFDSPLPYILTSALLGGQQLLVGTGGSTQFVNNRIYIQPGMMFKMEKGASLDIVNNDASINIGSRTYINQYDANNNISPLTPGFQSEGAGDAQVLFTSIFDNTAFTSYFDPLTQKTTILVPPIDSANSGGKYQPTPGQIIRDGKTPTGLADDPAIWGDVEIQTGAVAVVNDATFQYGGGQVNSLEQTLPYQSVLAFITLDTPFTTPLNTTGTDDLFDPLAQLGTHAMITNNNFFDNVDAPMSIEPNGLLAANPLTPLESGAPYFRGNVMQRNGVDGLAVRTSDIAQLANTNFPPGRVETVRSTGGPGSPFGSVNLTVNSVWDLTDLTYVVRGSIVLAGYYDGFSRVGGGAPLPNPNAFGNEQTPFITLTIQSQLPGALLADGSSIPTPGQSPIIKLMSDYTPNGAGTVAAFGSVGVGASENVGAGFVVGVDDGVDPPTSPPDPLIDPGAGSQLRITGIAGNQSTNQARVPVIITSLRDGTVGTTVRGVVMNNIWESDPNGNAGLANGTPSGKAPTDANLTTPAPGDGGYIYFGGNSLTSYNLLDPRSGNIIDNADIRYLTRIEVQGGGIIDVPSTAAGVGAADLQTKLGQTALTQFNTATAMTISDSNLSNFSDAAVFIHSGQGALIRPLTVSGNPGNETVTAGPVVRDTTGDRTQGTDIFLTNDTITNSPVGVADYSDTDQTGAPGNGHAQTPELLTLLNDTFYNDTIAMNTVAAGGSSNDQVYWLAMDNIFSNSSNTAILTTGPQAFSQSQYNLFFNNGTNINAGPGLFGNVGAVIGNPDFVNPAAGNFQLGPNSAAIDAGRSEIGPLPAGDALYPTVNQQLNPISLTGTNVSGIRTDPSTLTPPETPGRSNAFGGNAIITDPRKIVTLPGTPGRGFDDEWVAAPLTTSTGAANPNAYAGSAANLATFAYAPISGERDELGNLRVKDPNSPNVGFGSRPFFDIGAYEYVAFEFTPTHVTNFSNGQGVIATLPNGTTHDLYVVNGIGSVNQDPTSIQFHFDRLLAPGSITGQSVLLEEAGSGGNFGSGVSFINLSGRLSFNSTTMTLSINTSGLNLPENEYRIVLQGNGSSFLTDPQGHPIDGQNTLNDDPNNPQLALPSGAGLGTGTNFYLTFTIDTSTPTLVAGSFEMSPASDTNYADSITANNTPSFIGRITNTTPTPPVLAGNLANATVNLYVFNYSTSQFQLVGTTLTNATGNFTVTPNAPLPDSPYNVGPDGLLNSPGNAGLSSSAYPNDTDDSGYGLAVVQVINAAGTPSIASPPSVSSLPSYDAGNATSSYVVDTQAPTPTSFTPTPGTVVSTGANGKVTISFTTDKNIDPKSLNNNTIQVINAGPDGVFGTKDDVPIPIDPGSFVITPLKNGAQGPEQISFTISSNLTNGPYLVILRGAGSNVITDIAGNALNGSGTAGSDINWTFFLFNPATEHLLFVGPASDVTNPSATLGSRENPYPKIQTAINAADPGDIVAVLPGVYTEAITLRSYVRVFSADISSTDSSLIPGQALQTVIRPPVPTSSTTTPSVAVTANNVASVPGLATEIAGFTIATPLIGNQANGTIDPTSVGVQITNSNVYVDKNYLVDSGFGILVNTSGSDAPTPTILDDVAVGNIYGVFVNDTGSTGSVVAPTNVTNDDLVLNTVGLNVQAASSQLILAVANNDIFWENHDLTTARNGTGAVSSVPNVLVIRNSMFLNNGPSDSIPGDNAFGIGNGFEPENLTSTPDALGNFLGAPAFVSPTDPRPNADGPGTFFLSANYDLKATSAAINAANNAVAPSVDFLYRTPVTIAGKGFPGTGPASVGAFYYMGKGGIPSGGTFNVSSSTVIGSPSTPTTPTFPIQQLPGAITVGFTNAVDPKTVSATDLVLSGTAVSSVNPAHASSFTWIDNHTIQFNLSGQYKPGTLTVSIPAGAIRNTQGQPIPAFSTTVQVVSNSTTAPAKAAPATTPVVVVPVTSQSITPAPAPTPTPVTPAPAAAPTTPVKPAAAKKHSVLHFLKKKKKG
jgi:hypothetical protein